MTSGRFHKGFLNMSHWGILTLKQLVGYNVREKLCSEKYVL